MQIALLKANLVNAHSEELGTVDINELRKKIDELMAQNAALQEKLIKDNDEVNATLTLVIRSLSHQPPSSSSSLSLPVSFFFVCGQCPKFSIQFKLNVLIVDLCAINMILVLLGPISIFSCFYHHNGVAFGCDLT